MNQDHQGCMETGLCGKKVILIKENANNENKSAGEITALTAASLMRN